MTRDHLNPELSQRWLLRSACSSREVALAANPGVRPLAETDETIAQPEPQSRASWS
jgi:hypothetical protein